MNFNNILKYINIAKRLFQHNQYKNNEGTILLFSPYKPSTSSVCYRWRAHVPVELVTFHVASGRCMDSTNLVREPRDSPIVSSALVFSSQVRTDLLHEKCLHQ